MKLEKSVGADEYSTFRYAQHVGDWNPLHVNTSYAEREDTFGDGTLVHGAHIIGWVSGLLSDLGAEVSAEVVLVDIQTEFHNPLPTGHVAQLTLTIDDDHLPSDDEPKVVSGVGFCVVDGEHDGEKPDEYATGSATVMLDSTVDPY